MSLIKCGTSDVLTGHIHMPSRGPWFAELDLDTDTAPSGKVNLASDGGLSIKGTVVKPGADRRGIMHTRMVGGAGGLAVLVGAASYANALLSDPLNAIMSASGESLSSTISTSITSIILPFWSHLVQSARAALDLLVSAAARALGLALTWRMLSDGTVWIGQETWPSQAMAAGADLVRQFPSAGRYELGVQTLSLLPGVNLASVGNVGAVDHWVADSNLESWAWLA